MVLRYLYVGSDDTGADLAAWLRLPGAEARWRFHAFGADVAAVDLGAAPLVLVADHRPAGSVLPIYEAPDLDAAIGDLAAAGWAVDGPMGTPDGPAAVLHGPGGAVLGLLQVDRPNQMDRAYADADNKNAVRPIVSDV